ncbi:M81 family metallopeptidase [Pseudogracilibacillus sp. SE30717A]|uniref:M81 family metallopeptidase n=1 Tax=Pseudogracilibacillus sp. SE30717A TaxID=3098293 RepID=UPI00300DF036
MKIIIGGLYHESNTFNPMLTEKDHFSIVEGNQVYDRVCSTQVFREEGATVIPSIYATALSSGVVSEKTYRYFSDKILTVVKKEADIDGIWLHLHGSMTVENIGSGELQLLKEIREIVGFDIPISLTMDIHGNNTDELKDYANIIRAYRTVPHIDQCETEMITAKLLVDSIRSGEKITPAFVRLPFIIGGEQAIGNQDPLKSIFNKLEEIENSDGIASASFFIGFSWADTKNTSASIYIVPETQSYYQLAQEQANKLAEYVYSRRNEFKLVSIPLNPQEAIEKALNSTEKPVFISDSGDNTTGGGIGVNTELLSSFLQIGNLNNKKVCIAAIYDEKASKISENYNLGEEISLDIGIGFDSYSKSVTVRGIVKAKGALLGYLGGESDYVGSTCTISVGDIDIVIADKGHSFITMNHFAKAGLKIDDYDIIVVKQGYLFAELAEISKLHILAITQGATYQLIEELDFKNIKRPIYPFDEVELKLN